MNGNDVAFAILTVALNEYITECAAEGKAVTALAAGRALSAAQRLGIQPPRSLRLLGFGAEGEVIAPLRRTSEVYRQALQQVIQTGNARDAIELAGLFRRRSEGDA